MRFTIAEGATKEQLEATIKVARKKLKEQKKGAGNGGKAQGEQTWTGGNMYEILENRDSSKSLTCAKVVSSQKLGRQKTKTRVCMSVVKGQGGKEGKTGKVFSDNLTTGKPKKCRKKNRLDRSWKKGGEIMQMMGEMTENEIVEK